MQLLLRIGVGIAVLAGAVILSYLAGAFRAETAGRQKLANLVLGPLEPQLTLLSEMPKRADEPSSMLDAMHRTLTMALSTIAVERPNVESLNAGALASLCLGVKLKDQLVSPNDPVSVLVNEYLRQVEVETRLEAVKRRQTAPATRCALI
jgi:hypothetical protein